MTNPLAWWGAFWLALPLHSFNKWHRRDGAKRDGKRDRK